MILSVHDMTEFCTAAFCAVGLSADAAKIAADNLVSADADGVRTHGLARLDAYLKAFERGAIKAQPQIAITRHAATAVIDGDNGSGPVVAHAAVREAMDLARQYGVGLVTVRGSNHFGAAGHFTQMAAAEGMVAFAMSNSSATVAPLGGTKPAFGTNPLAFGAPGGVDPDFALDMASSIASRGQLRLAQVKGGEIPSDWAVSAEGRPARTADEAMAGALFPFGGAKGYSIALMIEIMSSMLSGAASGQEVNSMYNVEAAPANVGHAFIAIDIAAFRPVAEFTSHYSRFAQSLRQTPPLEGGPAPRLPGESKARIRQDSQAEGVKIPANVVTEMRAIAARLDLTLPAKFQSENDHANA